jgi:flagellin
MFVNTNVAALNAWQNLDNTQTQMNNTLQQLSSGYRINTAANDPAGLAISQQMQSQINGMNQAYQNAQSGITLLQTADGAMGQIQNILQSMYSLASEAATGTENSTDLSALQQEMNQYAQEITQIANTTQFNNLNLLGGAFQSQQIQIGANYGQTLTMSVDAVDAASLGIAGQSVETPSAGSIGLVSTTSTPSLTGFSAVTLTSSTYDYLAFNTVPWTPSITGGLAGSGAVTAITGSYVSAASETIQLAAFTATESSSASVAFTATYNGSTFTGTAVFTGGSSTTGTLTLTDGQGNTLNLVVTDAASPGTGYAASVLTVQPQATTFMVGSQSTAIGSLTTSNALASSSVIYGAISSGQTITLDNSATSPTNLFTYVAGNGLANTTSLSWAMTNGSVGGTTTLAFNTADSYISIGTSGSYNLTAAGTTDTYQFGVSTDGAAGSGTPSNFTGATVSSGLYIGTQAFASLALTTLQSAINNVSSYRANVGAYQNRLQFASSQLQTTSNNLTVAQGGIMDADVAQQMSNLTKEQILQQSGVAMLAQANSMPQALLKLFP